MASASNSGSTKVEGDSEGSTQSTADMTAFVQSLLTQMGRNTFCYSVNTNGHENRSELDEMGNRIDELEQSINDLKTEMEGGDSAKSILEETRPSKNS